MRLRALAIERLPGIRPGFTVEELSSGVNVVVGPNASGKSSLVRGLRAALYREELHRLPVTVEAVFDSDRGELRAVRQGDQLLWQQAGEPVEPPPLPQHRFLPCFLLRVEDLLADDHETDRQIATRLARELAGGYDIPALREAEPFRVGARHGQRERKALEKARGQLRAAQRHHAELRGDEARLDELRRKQVAAEEAALEQTRCERALELLEARRGRRALEAELGGFPPDMERLQGNEADVLAQWRRKPDEQAAELDRLRRGRAEAQGRLDEAGLPDGGPTEATLADHRGALQRLQRLEAQIEHQREALRGARAERDQAVEALGGASGAAVRIDPATIRRVGEALEEKRRLEATVTALEREHERLPPEDGDPTGEIERLMAGRRELLQWLAAPTDPPWTRRRLLGAVSTAVAFAVALAAAAVGLHWGLSVLLVPFVLGAWMTFPQAAGAAERGDARRRFEALGIAGPEAWEAEGVRQCLSDLDRALQEARGREADQRRREALGRELDRRRGERDELLGRLQRLAAEVGYDTTRHDAELLRWLQLTHDHDQAARRVGELERALEAQEGEAQDLREQAGSFLAAYGETPEVEQPGGDTLLARLENLAERSRRHREAETNIARADQDIARVERERRAAEEAITAVFIGAGLEDGDDAGLRQRLERLGQWRQRRDDLGEARLLERQRREALGEAGGLMAAVEADDEEGLQRRRDAARERAGERDELLREIARIEEAIRRAGAERALEEARAGEQGAADALRERLDEALFAEAGQLLLDRVQEEHERSSRPPALRRAGEWFAHFTHHHYQLDFSADGGTRFAAVESATGERRNLAALSSGTRMQLLLAVRVAFALEVERGAESLPLVLDEALTTADPERFRAAVESLHALADSGRQVFYLTAQPGDLAYWQERDPQVHWVDLARLRRRAGAVEAPEALALPPTAEVPAPQGRTAEDYAMALGVPPVAPWEPPESLHLFHLLRDDLGLLYRLICAGIGRLGALESLLGSPAANTLLDDEEKGLLRRRAAGARAWLEAWREGRGRPVDRDALEASGAVSETFIDRVDALNRELGGDARALLDALEAGAVSRFRSNAREELEEWLREHEHLDGREVLDEAALKLRVLAAMGGADTSADAVAGEAQWLADALAAVVSDSQSSP
ncbi:hypothetical protein [Arhodomonas sp. SL1]|uniref:AAA family ATPase n=1 Tax=Arhodomonas sp. SL1 TaxID=3425691 RepID=UPI003F8810E6